MKQFNYEYTDDESFYGYLDGIRDWCADNLARDDVKMVFRIYSQDMSLEHMEHICDAIGERLPNALYMGTTTNANIVDGVFTRTQIVVTCTVFERESTRVMLVQYPFTEENSREDARALAAICRENPWVTAVEMLATIMNMSMKGFCDEMSKLPPQIQVFGGGAFNPNMDDETAGVFSKGNGFLWHGIVFLLMGGEDLHIYGTYITGWKPLQRRFCITSAEKEVLHELDGKPAFDVYHRFFNIKKNDKFFSNTLEFPLFMDHKGIDILRSPLAVDDTDSLIMSSDMEEGTYVRLAYGDPETILRSIHQDGQEIADFWPEVIETFSCAVRRAFWGDANISQETELFEKVAPTSGFYTHGEFLRINGDMLNFNVTLVVIAMREGDPVIRKQVNFYDARMDNLEKIPMIWRFVSFIEAATTELEEMNRKIAIAAITDGLTQLYNRAEIERRIREALQAVEDGASPRVSLVMLDIDNFKRVNDTYGHKEGDEVIKGLARLLLEAADDIEGASSGRWGGEEFMVLLPGKTAEEAMEVAESIRAGFAEIEFEQAGKQTVSIGVTQAREGESVDSFCNRVDQGLYESKESGKNRVTRVD